MAEQYYIRTKAGFEHLKGARLGMPREFDGILPAIWRFHELNPSDSVWEMDFTAPHGIPSYKNCEVWVVYTDSAVVYRDCIVDYGEGCYTIYASDSELVARPEEI